MEPSVYQPQILQSTAYADQASREKRARWQSHAMIQVSARMEPPASRSPTTKSGAYARLDTQAPNAISESIIPASIELVVSGEFVSMFIRTLFVRVMVRFLNNVFLECLIQLSEFENSNIRV